MKVTDTFIPGVKIFEPKVFVDSRGYFMETWSQKLFDDIIGKEVIFVQDNESKSSRGVIRGLHFQAPPYAQAKLVRCLSGRVLDVAFDIRIGSPTYGKYIAVELSSENHLQLYLPHGMAHGFAVLSEEAVFAYKCDNYYAPQSEGGLNPFDKDIAVNWPFSENDAILSDKDLRASAMADFISPFHFDKTIL